MKIERLLAIVMILLSKESVVGKELAERFDVSLRTIYRDIASINEAGIPIITSPGVGGGIAMMKSYKVTKGIFTRSDLASMMMGLGFASSAFSHEEIAHTLAKIASMVPKEHEQEIGFRANQIMFDAADWIGGYNLRPKLEQIRAALDGRKRLTFQYWNRQGEKTLREVEPHQLLLKANRWYLQGFCVRKQDFRLFNISRMAEIATQEGTFTPRAIPPAFTAFTDAMSKKTSPIELIVRASAMNRMLDYCREDSIMPVDDAHYRVSLDFIQDDYGYGILMSFGADCVCINPIHVREELTRRLKQALHAQQAPSFVEGCHKGE